MKIFLFAIISWKLLSSSPPTSLPWDLMTKEERKLSFVQKDKYYSLSQIKSFYDELAKNITASWKKSPDQNKYLSLLFGKKFFTTKKFIYNRILQKRFLQLKLKFLVPLTTFSLRTLVRYFNHLYIN